MLTHGDEPVAGYTLLCHGHQPKEEAKVECKKCGRERCEREKDFDGCVAHEPGAKICHAHDCAPKEEAKGERCAKCGGSTFVYDPTQKEISGGQTFNKLVRCPSCSVPKTCSTCGGNIGGEFAGCSCPTPTNPKKEDWEEEFDKKFKILGLGGLYKVPTRWMTDIKSFLSSLLAEARREQQGEFKRLKEISNRNARMIELMADGYTYDQAFKALDRVKPESRKE